MAGNRGRVIVSGNEVTLRDIAERTGLQYDTIRSYTKANGAYAGQFPKPTKVNRLGHGLRWDWTEVEAFLASRPGRGRAVDPYADKRRMPLPAPQRKAPKVSTRPIKKATQRICACGCGTPLKAGDRTFAVKSKPGRFVLEACGLRIKAAAKKSAS